MIAPAAERAYTKRGISQRSRLKPMRLRGDDTARISAYDTWYYQLE